MFIYIIFEVLCIYLINVTVLVIRIAREEQEKTRSARLRMQRHLESLRSTAAISESKPCAENTPVLFDLVSGTLLVPFSPRFIYIALPHHLHSFSCLFMFLFLLSVYIFSHLLFTFLLIMFTFSFLLVYILPFPCLCSSSSLFALLILIYIPLPPHYIVFFSLLFTFLLLIIYTPLAVS